MAVEDPGENQPRHRHRSIVGPAEAPPHLEARKALRGIVRGFRRARGMQPDRQVIAGHGGEERGVAGIVERPPCDMGENLDADGAQLLDRAPELGHGGVHIAQGQSGDESRKAVLVATHQLGHAVIGDARQRRGLIRRREILDRRIGQRHDLPVVAELVHAAEAAIEIVQLADRHQPLNEAEARAARLERGGQGRGQDVRIDVDDHASASCRASPTPTLIQPRHSCQATATRRPQSLPRTSPVHRR